MANYKSEWMSIEDAAKVLNCSPKDIEILINVTMVADIRNGGEKLVNPKEIRSFLGKARVIADKLLSSLKVEPKTKEEYEFVGGKAAAEKIGIAYDVFIKQCEDKTIPGEKRGRGWRIEKSKLDELIKAKKGPSSLQDYLLRTLLIRPPILHQTKAVSSKILLLAKNQKKTMILLRQ